MSYLIVDQADTDLEMANDPFLEAGISVPEELPYQKIPSSRNSSIRSVMKKKHSVSLVSIRCEIQSFWIIRLHFQGGQVLDLKIRVV